MQQACCVQELMGQPPDAYYSYFAQRFPRLLLSVLFLVLRSGSVSEAVFDKFELTADGVDFTGCEQVFDASLPVKPPPPQQQAPAATAPQV